MQASIYRMRFNAKALVLTAGLLLVLWLAAPAMALAHSQLLSSSPAAGSTIDKSPPAIQLNFSEAVSLQFSSIRLFDRSRKEQQVGALAHVNNDDSTVTAPVQSNLDSGIYTVAWRVVSAVDGHLTAGSFAFKVRPPSGAGGTTGTPEADEPVVPQTDLAVVDQTGASENVDLFRWLERAIFFACAVLLLGGPLITILVVEPAASERREAWGPLTPSLARRCARYSTWAALVLLLVLMLDLLFQVGTEANTDVLGALGRGDLALVTLDSTRYGFTWVLKIISALALLGMMLFIWLKSRRGGGALWELSIAAASLLLLAQSLGSHAAAASAGGHDTLGLPLPVVSDWLHQVVVGAWVGGLGYMALALYPAFRAMGVPPEERRSFLGSAIPRFSRLAVISVIVLVITGTYGVIVRTTDLGALLASAYGRVLLIKVGVYITLVVIGAVNLSRLTPMLRARVEGKENPGGAASEQARAIRPVRLLSRNIRIEVALAVVALACAAGLTLLPPPANTPSAVAAQAPTGTTSDNATAAGQVSTPTVAPTPRPAVVQRELNGYMLKLTARPSFDGDSLTLEISRTSPALVPLTDVNKVLFKITPQDIDAGTTTYQGSRQGAADPSSQVWATTGTFFPLEGNYQATIDVQRTQSDDIKAAFRLVLSTSGDMLGSIGQLVDVRLETDPSPPISGTAAITVTLLDESHAPLKGLTVSVSPLMPSHGHVEPTVVARPVPGRPGVYAAQIHFTMGGGWLFVFTLDRPGLPPLKVDASLDVVGPTPTAGPGP